MNDMLAQLQKAWSSLTNRQRATMILSAALTVAAVAAIVWWARQPTWTVLYTGLDPKDSQAVVTELQSRKVPFQLGAGGTSVEVPIDQVDKLRMELAAKNLPGSGRFGFLEMFGQDSLTQSDRTQKMRYQKALEDELARTIESLQEVRAARVHLVMPGDRVFLDDQDVAKASVTLTLNRSAVPTTDEVRSIVHIVSGAVPGLAPERVSVVDTLGHTLWEGDGATGGLVTAREQEMKKSVEKDVDTKIARVLEPLLGPDHYVVRTSADMDFQKVLRKEKTYDTENPALISEQKSKGRQSSAAGTAGTPGTASNLPNSQGPTAGNGGGESSLSDSTVNNYEYSVVERTVEEPVGTLKRLSVAVVLDQGDKNAAGRSADDLKRIEQLVKAAISFDGNRGDVVTVDQQPFAHPVEPAGPRYDWKQFLPYAKYPALLLMLLLVFFLFWRPFVKTAREAVHGSGRPAPALAGTAVPAATTAEIEQKLLGGSASHVEILRQRLAKLAAEQPVGMAQTVRVWLHEPKQPQSPGE